MDEEQTVGPGVHWTDKGWAALSKYGCLEPVDPPDTGGSMLEEKVPQPGTEEWAAFVAAFAASIDNMARDAVANWLAPITGEKWAHGFAYALPFEAVQWIHRHFPHRDEAGQPPGEGM